MDRSSIKSIIVSALLVIIVLFPFDESIKFGILIFGLLLIVFIKRGMFYFLKANKLYNMGKAEAARPLFIKACKVGIMGSYEIKAAAFLMQAGFIQDSKNILMPIINSKYKKIIVLAKMLLSLCYWNEKDVKNAIIVAEELYNSGTKDKNLLLSLAQYYIADNRLDSFYKLTDSLEEDAVNTPAGVDILAMSNILRGNWKKASTQLRNLLNKRHNFADPYLHLAQVHIHFKNFKEATDILYRALNECLFLTNAVISREAVSSLLYSIKQDKDAIYALNEENAYSIIQGKYIVENATIEEEDEEIDEVNTSLSDDDEEWIKKHN